MMTPEEEMIERAQGEDFCPDCGFKRCKCDELDYDERQARQPRAERAVNLLMDALRRKK